MESLREWVEGGGRFVCLDYIEAESLRVCCNWVKVESKVEVTADTRCKWVEAGGASFVLNGWQWCHIAEWVALELLRLYGSGMVEIEMLRLS